MATYDNSYAIKITPNTPNLRGLTTNYSNDGQTNLGGIGLGDLFELDYDRNKIEQIFNQGTDAQYALMQKEAQIAQNQYANNQFQQQQLALDTLRAQRNSQIASGMARGLNAAADQATVLGLQQEGMSGALELANEQQTMADTIAAEYAQNVVDALKESNSVKQAIAEVSAALYDADMLGYTGELSAAAQMDANASDRYGYEVGLEGTKYAADKEYAATIEAANIQAAATKAAAAYSASGSGSSGDLDYPGIVEKYTDPVTGEVDWVSVKGDLLGHNKTVEEADNLIAETKVNMLNSQNDNKQTEGITIISNTDLWVKALDGNRNALTTLGINKDWIDIYDSYSKYNNSDVKAAVAEAQRRINNGTYTYRSTTQLMHDLRTR